MSVMVRSLGRHPFFGSLRFMLFYLLLRRELASCQAELLDSPSQVGPGQRRERGWRRDQQSIEVRQSLGYAPAPQRRDDLGGQINAVVSVEPQLAAAGGLEQTISRSPL